jgi:hypothetical protein
MVAEMTLGIVGSEASKFTDLTERRARAVISALIKRTEADLVISGRSPLGGIDWWAIEQARGLGVPTREYAPKIFTWAAPGGFRDRNTRIARDSDLVACITLKELPASYHGMRFPGGCYHCKTPPEHHVKSGGCWTMHLARKLNKRSLLIVIGADGSVDADLNVLRQYVRRGPAD